MPDRWLGSSTAYGRMPLAIPPLQPSATGLRGNFCNYGTAEARGEGFIFFDPFLGPVYKKLLSFNELPIYTTAAFSLESLHDIE
jgi:hypothetical protein